MVGDTFYGWNSAEACEVVSRAGGALSIVKDLGYPEVDLLWPPATGAANWALSSRGQLRVATHNFHDLAAVVSATIAGYQPGGSLSFVDLGDNGLLFAHGREVSLILGGATRVVTTGKAAALPKVVRSFPGTAVVVGVGPSVLRVGAETTMESVPWPNAPGLVLAYALGSDGTEWISNTQLAPAVR